jgi:hypothetical protein
LKATWIGLAETAWFADQKAGLSVPIQTNGIGSSALRPSRKEVGVLSMVASPSARATAS